MRSNILFFSKKLCTGCLLCEMACSLIHTGECSRKESLVKVFLHPYLGVPMVGLSQGCDCPDGKEKCLEVCNQEALRSVERDAAVGMLSETEWVACPII